MLMLMRHVSIAAWLLFLVATVLAAQGYRLRQNTIQQGLITMADGSSVARTTFVVEGETRPCVGRRRICVAGCHWTTVVRESI
jgi:hypothetical protein